MLKILIADDHPAVRQGLRFIVQGHPEWEWVGEATDGAEALQQIAALRPDVVLLDLQMPHTDGMEVLRLLATQHRAQKVLVTSAAADSLPTTEVMQRGALAFLNKSARPLEIANAIAEIAQGSRYLSDEPSRSPDESGPDGVTTPSPLRFLSPRELQVLRLVVNGFSSQKIAKQLSLSPKTIDTYRSRLMFKLGTADLPALVRLAIRERVIKEP